MIVVSDGIENTDPRIEDVTDAVCICLIIYLWKEVNQIDKQFFNTSKMKIYLDSFGDHTVTFLSMH